MGIRQAWHDIRELRRELAELSAPSHEEEESRYKLAVSATRFSRRSKRVVDDKLNFSATLMRAGEVDAANRLLEEFERDIRDEEAALIECVNEVKVANSLRRERMSRLRVVRLMAVALLGACVMSFSALGIAVAGMFQDRESHRAAARAATRGQFNPAAGRRADARPDRNDRRSMRALRVAGVKQALTPQQLHTAVQLAASGDDGQLQSFLMGLLPSAVAERVSDVLGVVDATVATPAPQPEVDPDKIAAKTKKAQDKAASETPKGSEEEAPPKDDTTEPADPGSDPDNSGSQDDEKKGDDGDGDSPGVLPKGLGDG
jgi:hypothetical protein